MDAQTVLRFMEEVGKLKIIPRSGWIIRGMKNPESIAEHCYRTTLLAMLLADILNAQGTKVNVEKVMRLALLHDIAEAQIGDIPYPAMRFISNHIKEAAERTAIQDMVRPFEGLGEYYAALWNEFESGTTVEGQLVRAADKLEMMIQVAEYEKVGYQSLGDFWTNMAGYPGFQFAPFIQEIINLLYQQHNAQKKGD